MAGFFWLVLTLTQLGLAPSKKRQAYLGALTFRRTAEVAINFSLRLLCDVAKSSCVK